MRLVETNGLVLIGPGSEWLWIALQFVALSITGLAIFRQVRLQASSNALAVGARLADSFRTELLRPKALALMDVLRDNQTITPAMERVGGWFDGTASAIHNRYVPSRMGWQEWGEIAQVYWAVFGPAVVERRKLEPGLWKDWERWVDDLAAKDRKAGTVHDVSPATLARWVPDAITYYVETLRAEDDARRGVIPTWPVPEPPGRKLDPSTESRSPEVPELSRPRPREAG